MKTFSVLNPETGEVLRTRRTPRPYTHAAIAKDGRGWYCVGFSLSRINAAKMLAGWIQRMSKHYHLAAVPADAIVDSRVVEVQGV